ncbi:MAG: ABC transporter permease [Myxococcales bacterium]|nr:ABC transporter permease [Myxococcales bacterium]
MNRFAWSMALRSLRHNIGQTMLTMGIVTISVTLIIGLSTMMQGIQSRITTVITESMPHISVLPEERIPQAAWQISALQQKNKKQIYVGKSFKMATQIRKLENWQTWGERFSSFSPYIKSVVPVVSEQAILFRGAQPTAVSVTGVVPEEYDKVIQIQDKLISGKFFGLNTGQIVVGVGVATDLSLSLGDKVRLVNSTSDSMIFTVVGIFATGARMRDSTAVYIPLRDAQSLFGLATAISAFYIKLSEIYEAKNLAVRMRHRVPFEVRSWMEDNENFMTAMQSQNMTTNIILLLTTIAAGLGIASILIMSVVSKMRELGILKAMGATRWQIISVFTLQGVIISFIGACMGTGVGIGIARYLTSFKRRDTMGRLVSVFSVEVKYSLIVTAFLIALLVGFLAALYPAWRASRVNPIEVIRGA